MHLSVEGIQRILLLLACSLMVSHSQSCRRKRQRGRKEEEDGASGGDGLGAHEPQHDGTHRQGDNVQESGAPFLFSLNLNSVFYLCELGSQNRYAPLAHKPNNRAPLVSFHMFSY
jgi:hypothetical protein